MKLHISDRWKELTQKETWASLLKEAAFKWPDKEALVFEDERVTFKEYWEKSWQVAKGLFAAGVRPGDHVGLWMTNRPEWCYSRFGIYQLGAVMIPLNTRYRTEELKYVLNQSDAKVLILQSKFLGQIDAMGLLKGLCPELDNSPPGKLNLAKFPFLKVVIALDGDETGCFGWEEVLRLGEGVDDQEIKIETWPDDLIHIIYTSGTTGFPKGVMTPNSNNIAFSATSSEAFSLREGDRFLCLPPFFGNMGIWGVNICLIAGATLVMTSHFRPLDALMLLEREKITHTMFVPTMLIDILARPDFGKYNLGSLKHIVCGGTVVSSKLIRDTKEKMGAEVYNGYGLVEASGLSSWTPAGDTPEHIEKSIGLPLSHNEMTIRDPLTSQELPLGKEGDICMKEVFPGSCHMKGYYKKPELTAETIREGWLHSGDLGVKDSDGYFRITGRVKEMFTVGGFNVSPPEIEETLRKHSKVKDIAVVGVPDERLGEVGASYIILKPGETATEEEIINYCKAGMADIKVPRHVFFVQDFPLNPQGKVQKFKLKEEFIKERSLEK
ncbi:MAG TPA: AMP-binding protein [Syntrophales bacterium]|nr:AMP-binding protein [Syntrophales bacterium]